MYFFGTDGIRDLAQRLLDDKTPYFLGKALAMTAKTVMIAKDVRLSGNSIERQLCRGLLESDVRVLLCGILPTPALAYLAKEEKADCAVMITASHNPPQFNGLKVFGKRGKKLSPEAEAALDSAICKLKSCGNLPLGDLDDFNFYDEDDTAADCAAGELNGGGSNKDEPGRGDNSAADGEKYCRGAHVLRDAADRYRRHLIATFPRLDGLKVRLDCAFGCFAQFAKSIFEGVGAKVVAINDVRDGSMVNVDCGSTHIDRLLSEVRQDEIGFAFDGDGDRAIAAVDGEVYDGDDILLAISTLYKLRGKLTKFVVGTRLTSYGLEKELAAKGVALLRADVGDKNISDGLKKCGGVLGGEKSGHIIMLDRGETGDGVATALTVLDAYKTLGILPKLQNYPSIEFNVYHPRPAEGINEDAFQAKLHKAREKFEGKGRLVVRPSGTEPYIRVFYESYGDRPAELAALRAIFENS